MPFGQVRLLETLMGFWASAVGGFEIVPQISETDFDLSRKARFRAAKGSLKKSYPGESGAEAGAGTGTAPYRTLDRS